MTIYAGSDGSVEYDGVVVAQANSWSLTVGRESADITCSGAWRRRSVLLKRSASGSVSFFYDPDDAAAQAWLAKLDEDGAAPITLKLIQGKGSGRLAKEDGLLLLKEDGCALLLDGDCFVVFGLGIESGGSLLLESGDRMLLEDSSQNIGDGCSVYGYQVDVLPASAPISVSVGAATAGVLNFQVTGPVQPL